MPRRLTSTFLVAAAVATIVAVGCGSSSGAAASKVAVFPMAGTPDANRHTQISFRGAAPADLTGIKVVGSKSGNHSGSLKAHSDGNGASFVPSKSFSSGETVTVTADPTLIGEHKGKLRFQIASPAPIGVPGQVQGDPGGNPSGAQHFVSRPDLQPPSIKFQKNGSKTAPGDLFLGPKAGPGQDGTEITDSKGRLVWFKRDPKLTSATDFRVQTYHGNAVLTWWQGGVHHGQGQGHGVIVDSTYKQIARVDAGNGYKADFHDFTVSRDGTTAFLIIYEPVLANLQAVGGSKKGSVLDGIVQEIDIKTGLVIFEWHSLGNIRSTESYSKPPKKSPFDITHVNSVFEEKNGNLLVSARDLHSALEINRHSGKLLWRLGGKKSNFNMTGGSQFISQHSVARAPDGRLTVFDNGSPPYPGRLARGLVLKVQGKTVSVSHDFKRGGNLHSPSQGSVQALPNGNFLVGWGGSTPYFTEFNSKGKIVMDGRFAVSDDTYRAWRFPWVGQPSAPPDVVAQTDGDVFVSWNGATEVAKWRVTSTGVPPGSTTVNKSGFETKIHLSNHPTSVTVQALDKDGTPLGQPRTVTPG